MAKTALIDRTCRVRLPNGKTGKVNCFDLNLAKACGDIRYVQVSDGAWFRVDLLQVSGAAKSRSGSGAHT